MQPNNSLSSDDYELKMLGPLVLQVSDLFYKNLFKTVTSDNNNVEAGGILGDAIG
ncbi:hypothetical protein [Lactococcus cremoris]|uniref:hypothetical protein n=1 Tax=Lactococcus lactis subsp. cremoris TaxID=1359 RepID=UPI001639E7F4|nr:hypothetical protein [Lactococcus cremoris]